MEKSRAGPARNRHTNPLKDMRLLLRITQEDLSKKAGVTRQLVIRTEQGVYADPPPIVVKTLFDLSDDGNPFFNVPGFVDPANGALANSGAVGFPFDEGSVYHLYHRFQDSVRKSNYGKLDPGFNFSEVPTGVHPWVEWRMHSGITARIGPAKFYCVHPALLHKFEVQPHLVQSPPSDLLGALSVSGYSSEVLDSFMKSYDTYKWQRKQELRKLNE